MSEVRLLDEKGAHLGVFPLGKAIETARAKGLDLIEIQPSAHPPVARMGDWTKFLYHQEKIKRKQKAHRGGKVKEIRFGLKIFEHDLGIKAARAHEFLDKNYKVKVQLVLRRFEKGLINEAKEKIKNFLASVEVLVAFDQQPLKNPMGYTFIIRKAKEESHEKENKDKQVVRETVQNNENR